MALLRGLGRGLLWLLAVLVAILLLFRISATFRENGSTVPPGSQLFDTSFGEVAVTVTGPEEGQPVLLIHGTAAWGGFWRDVAADLARQGYQAVAVDLPPFGYSDHDPESRYDRTAQAARIADISRAFGGNAVLVGHSFGAGSATEAALRHPGQFSRLVLVDAALGKLDPPPGAGPLAGVTGVDAIGQLITSALVTNPLMTGTLLRSFMYRDEAADPWLATLQQPMERKGTTAAYAAWLPQLFTANDASLSRRREALRAIKVPVAIIWGDKDDVTPPQQGRELAALTRATSFQMLPEVGHIPHAEDPPAFKKALTVAISAPSH